MKMDMVMKMKLAALVSLPLLLFSCDKHGYVPEDNGPHYTVEDLEFDSALQAYMDTSYGSEITDVTVTENTVRVSGTYKGPGTDFSVVEIPPFMDLLRLESPLTEISPETETFTFEVGRYALIPESAKASQDGEVYDRLLSKWAIVSKGEGGYEPLSAARYADVIPVLRHPEPVPLRNKKGIGGIVPNNFISDFDDLDLGSATLNMFVTQFTYLSEGPGRIAHEYGGRTYWFDEAFVKENLDNMLLEAGKRNMAVAAILLVQPASSSVDKELGELLMPDECTSGTLTMPDMTKPESVQCFAAITDFLAERYCRENQEYGRVSKWIVMNEVDIADTWANIGTRPETVHVDYYVKVLRLVHNIVSQYDSNTEVMVSTSHSWTLSSGTFLGKNIIGKINRMTVKEGDFFWGLAFHSYPGNLLDPKVWSCPYSTFSMDTQSITFRNLEVLNKWIYQPENMYKGTVKRSVWLSEAGLNSPSYSDEDLILQAAGTAYSWKKVAVLDGIDSWQWHNWFDNVGDGSGALLGLRKYGDTASGEAKPAWYVFKAAGTSSEDEVFDKYLPVIGIGSWEGIVVPPDEIR